MTTRQIPRAVGDFPAAVERQAKDPRLTTEGVRAAGEIGINNGSSDGCIGGSRDSYPSDKITWSGRHSEDPQFRVSGRTSDFDAPTPRVPIPSTSDDRWRSVV